MVVTRKMAESARLLLMAALEDDELEQNDATVDCMDSEKVMSLYKTAAKKAHPDVGGTVEKFAAVDRAKHVLLEWLKRAERSEPVPAHGEKCPDCQGRGHLMVQRGFRAMRMQCPKCRGAGELGVEHDEGDGR